MTSRRRFLATAVAASAAGVAGCLSDDSGDGDGADADDGSGAGDDGAGDPGGEDPPELASRVRGAEGPLVEVFEDFRCPHCHEYATAVVPDIQAMADEGHLRFVTRDLPIPVDPTWSWRMPNLPRTAQAQTGSVETAWGVEEYVWHNWNGGAFSESYVRTVAEEFDLDPDRTWQAVRDERFRSAVEAERQRGASLGVEATPSVVVDDELLEDRSLAAVREAAGIDA